FGLTSNYDFRCKDLAGFVKHQKVWMTTGDDKLVSLSIPSSFNTGAPAVEAIMPIILRGRPLYCVNELEYRHASDTIYGNVWPTNYIVEIDYRSGACLSVWDLGMLSKSQLGDVDVLNGIACHPSKEECIITGKFWRRLHYVTFSKHERLAVVDEGGAYELPTFRR
ncbi:putative glutamine cyclotransferase, partial [Babesia divergens]